MKVGNHMSKLINHISDVYSDNFYDIDIDSFWNIGNQRELKIHRIHSYPAKFPSFILEKGLDYVNQKSFSPKSIADIFCGCGTVAFEAKRQNIDFWGCDINPIATMIAKAKSRRYKIERLKELQEIILGEYNSFSDTSNPFSEASERLKYWYDQSSYNQLYRLRQSICKIISNKSSYRLFFDCAFSNILKSTSRWLTKSIKPQIDPHKTPADVIEVFVEQCKFMIKAYTEIDTRTTALTKIVTGNIMDDMTKHPIVDMIITSPPYVTSYEYADLHQLSSLWLEYTDDYRSLRTGSIGSLYHNYDFDTEHNALGITGKRVISDLLPKDKSQARSVSKYFVDMQKVIQKSIEMLNENGYILLVVGDTEYKGVHIENVRHIVEQMVLSGYSYVNISKRKVTGKILTPYRNALGRFTNTASSKRVYGEEYIIIGQKCA